MTDNGNQYAEVRITEGKTGPRTVPLIDSIPILRSGLENILQVQTLIPGCLYRKQITPWVKN